MNGKIKAGKFRLRDAFGRASAKLKSSKIAKGAKVAAFASLTALFTACASNMGPWPDAVLTLSQQTPEVVAQKVQPAPVSIKADLQTNYTELLKRIEDKFNEMNPDQLVVVLSPDEISFSRRGSGYDLRNRVSAYLKERGVELEYSRLSQVARSLSGIYGPDQQSPAAIHVYMDKGEVLAGSSHKSVCIVIPERIDVHSFSLIDGMLGSGNKNVLLAAKNPGAEKVALRTTFHEMWHSIDPKYVIDRLEADTNDGPNYGYAAHKSETFADVAATLTMVALGHADVNQQYADLRAIRSNSFGPVLTGIYSAKWDFQYYGGANYFSARAMDLALASADKIKKTDRIEDLDLHHILTLAQEITEQGMLSREEYFALNKLHKKGASYLRMLERKSDGASKRKASFLRTYQERVELAYKRLTKDTGIKAPAYKDVVPPQAEKMANNIQVGEQQELYKLYQEKLAAMQGAQNPEQAAKVALLDDLRAQLHQSETRRPDIERKLLSAHLMIRFAMLETQQSDAQVNNEPAKRRAPNIS